MNKKNKKSINEKIYEILKYQKKLYNLEKKILKEEEEIEEKEQEIEFEEKKEEDLISDLESLEKKLNKNLNSKIKKITKRDFFKGFVGAFIGVVGHFAFSKAVDVGYHLNLINATFLYVFSFIMIVLMLYYTGFRNIETKFVLRFMPLRATVLYLVSFITVIFVYLIFGKIDFSMDIVKIYKLVSASMVLAVMGAGTADLIGRGEE